MKKVMDPAGQKSRIRPDPHFWLQKSKNEKHLKVNRIPELETVPWTPK